MCVCVNCRVVLLSCLPYTFAPSPCLPCLLCGSLLSRRWWRGGCDGIWVELGCSWPELLLLLGVLLLLLLRHPLFVGLGPLRAALLRRR